MNRILRPSIVLCLMFVFTTGCEEKKEPEKPVQVSATVVEATESENNHIAKYSDGIYQQFFEVKLEITEPAELAGQWINLHAETRFGSTGEMVSEGTRLKFFIEPKLINREEACKIEDLIGWSFIKD